jgi:hypothetical protein
MIPKSDSKVPPAFMSKKKQQFATRGILLKYKKIFKEFEVGLKRENETRVKKPH